MTRSIVKWALLAGLAGGAGWLAAAEGASAANPDSWIVFSAPEVQYRTASTATRAVDYRARVDSYGCRMTVDYISYGTAFGSEMICKCTNAPYGEYTAESGAWPESSADDHNYYCFGGDGEAAQGGLGITN